MKRESRRRKKAYVKPELTTHGSVETITQNSADPSASDGQFGISVVN